MADLHERTTVVRVAGAGADGVVDGGTDDVPAVAVGSTGARALEPLMLATHDGETAFVANADGDDVAAAVDALASGDLPADADATVSHETGAGGLPVPDLDGFAGERSVLARCGWLDPTDVAAYERAVGFSDADADAALDAADDLLGRGWGDWAADEPVGDLWAGVRERNGPAAVVVNAHGNPGDALLLESDPFAVLDGAVAAARAVGAETMYLYASEDDEAALASARYAIKAADLDVSATVVAGPPAYRAGEPTMAIEAIEGNHRLEARLRPPGPDVEGVHGDPTVVHTARTYAHLAAHLHGRGADSRVVSVTGDADAATLELGAEKTAESALDAAGVDEYTAACVGGRFGGLTADLDVALNPDALLGADLGTEGTIEVLGVDRCPVAFAGERANFAAEANCGRCVPCREGSTQLTELLRDVYRGSYDVDGIEELTDVMASTSICAFGRDAPRPVRTAMAEFGDAFEAHAAGECPSSTCAVEVEAR